MDVNDGRASVDELLDRAVAAINRGDHDTATSLAQQVLPTDHGNADAEDLLAVTGDPGEFRRLTILFADLVDSSRLSTQVELEAYHLLVARYREQVARAVDDYDPLGPDGFVDLPSAPGLGYEIAWDCIESHRVTDAQAEPVALLHPR
jgi:hypothetical protein